MAGKRPIRKLLAPKCSKKRGPSVVVEKNAIPRGQPTASIRQQRKLKRVSAAARDEFSGACTVTNGILPGRANTRRDKGPMLFAVSGQNQNGFVIARQAKLPADLLGLQRKAAFFHHDSSDIQGSQSILHGFTVVGQAFAYLVGLGEGCSVKIVA